ncbi:MAG: hypothetical protein U1U88_001445 [Lawsonella clevelandensis]
MPDLLQVSFLHIFSVSPMTLPKLTAKYGPKLIKKIADFVQGKLQNACLSTKPSGSTPHEYNHNPKPIKNPNKFPGKQAMNVQKIVDGLSVASETCRPLSEYTPPGKSPPRLLMACVSRFVRNLRASSILLPRFISASLNSSR